MEQRGTITGLLAAGAMFLAAGLSASPALAIEFTQEQKRAIIALLTAPNAAPGSSLDNPTGFGANWGDVYASIGGTSIPSDERAPGGDDYDGSAAFGFGYGDASQLVGIETTLNVISLTDNGRNSDVGDDTSFNFKIHRMINESNSIAFGWENVNGRGASKGAPISRYLAYSGLTALSDDPINPYILSYTVGVGNERFNRGENQSVEAFGSLSLQLTRQFAVVVDVNRDGTNVGVSAVPFQDYPVTVNVTAFDVNEERGTRIENGQKKKLETRYGATIAYSHEFD